MAHRYFTTQIVGDSVRIEGEDAVHLARVLRLQPGKMLTLCDGNKADYEAEITEISSSQVLCKILSSTPCSAEPTVWAEVYLGYTKGEKLEWAIQKAVELGASRIIPFFSANTVVKPKNEEEKNKRYNRIAAEAAKQCGRGILPCVALPGTFAEVLAQATKTDNALFLYEKGGQPLRTLIQAPSSIAIIAGPEGGFTPQEAALAVKEGCKTSTLGARILRSETAPLAALAAVMTLTGNLE